MHIHTRCANIWRARLRETYLIIIGNLRAHVLRLRATSPKVVEPSCILETEGEGAVYAHAVAASCGGRRSPDAVFHRRRENFDPGLRRECVTVCSISTYSTDCITQLSDP